MLNISAPPASNANAAGAGVVWAPRWLAGEGYKV